MNYSKCSSLVTVSAPEAVEADAARTVYWIKSWSETDMKPKGVVAFWDGDVLVGISVAPYDVARGGPWQEQRLFGMDTRNDGVRGESTMLVEDDWITSLVLHIPTLDFGHCSRRQYSDTIAEEAEDVTTSPRGLTVSTEKSLVALLTISKDKPANCRVSGRPQYGEEIAFWNYEPWLCTKDIKGCSELVHNRYHRNDW